MYELITTLLLALLIFIIYTQQKSLEVLRDSYTEFLTQHATYVKAVGDHSEAVQIALEDLDNKAEKSYYAVTALAAHVEYLEAQLEELKGDCNAL
jgi:predicted  nucleic acid-binding Zn-ribbon protein